MLMFTFTFKPDLRGCSYERRASPVSETVLPRLCMVNLIPAAGITYVEIWREDNETAVAHAHCRKIIPVSRPAPLVRS